jgi:hypothetical protein
MALPEPAGAYDLPDDAHVAFAGDGQVVYRALRRRDAAKDDFRSDQMANRAKGPTEPWIEHAGVSVYDDPDALVALLARFPVYIAELEVPADASCSVAKTGPPRHFTIWGEPKVLLASIRTVYRQNHKSGPLEPRP